MIVFTSSFRIICFLILSATVAACQPTIRVANVSNSGANSTAPRIIAVGGENGTVYVTWLDGSDVKIVKRRMAAQSTFSSPVDLGPSQAAGATILTGLEAAASGGNVYVAIPHRPASSAVEVFVASSNDNAVTFAPRVNISNSSNNNSMQPNIAASGSQVFVTWRESVGPDDHIMVAESTNGGGTFPPPLPLTINGADDIQPAIVIAQSWVYVLYCTDANKTAVRKRALGGATFAAEEILNPTGTTTPCGNERLDAYGNVAFASWTEGGNLFVARSTDGGSFGNTISVATGATPVSTVDIDAIGASRFYAAWKVGNNDLRAAGSWDGSSFDRGPFTVSDGFDSPQSARLGASGKFIHLYWAEPPGNTANSDSIHRTLSQDYGQTYSNPGQLTDSNDAALPGFLPDAVVRGSDRYVVYRRNYGPGASDIRFYLWRHYRYPWQTK